MADDPKYLDDDLEKDDGDPGFMDERSKDRLRRVARKQKGILTCILIYLGAGVGQFMLPPEIRVFAAIAIVVNAIVALYFVFSLAMEVYSVAAGVILGILTLVPLVGLIVLLSVNSKATAILREAGLKVGLMGADLNDIEAL